MVSLKLLLVVLIAEPVSAESRQWPFSLWRNANAKQADSLVELKSDEKVIMPAFFHTTPQISQKLASMKCDGMSYEKVRDPSAMLFNPAAVELEVVKMAPHNDGETTHKVMLVAGEHAREMISAETALGVVQELCSGSSTALKARKNTEYLIVVNANPRSRKLVEAGATCLRTNPDGVDTNRNWDDNFHSAHEESNINTNPGSTAFSEPETRILKKLAEDYKPHTFLDVHSGTLGLYLPNALVNKDHYAKHVESFISNINDENCKCPLGIANIEVGYQTSGSSLDYIYDKVGANFAMAMEVWAQPEALPELREKWSSQKKLLKEKPSFLQTDPKKNFNFIATEQAIEQALQGASKEDCFAYFNPTSEVMYKKTVSKWTNTLIELSITGRKIPASSSMLQKPETPAQKAEQPKQGIPMGHILRVGAIVLLMVGVWFLWQRFSHLFAKNKEAEATPLAQPKAMGPIQVTN